MAASVDVRVVSRRLVKASDSSIKPYVLTVSNLDLIARTIQTSMLCVYRKPSVGFDAVVAAFEAGLPSFLNHFFPLAGRIDVPEIRCNNAGAELVVGEARDVALASLDYHRGASTSVRVPYGEDVALSVQAVSFVSDLISGIYCASWDRTLRQRKILAQCHKQT